MLAHVTKSGLFIKYFSLYLCVSLSFIEVLCVSDLLISAFILNQILSFGYLYFFFLDFLPVKKNLAFLILF